MDKFYVWLLPAIREVYIEDRGSIPVFACNLSKSEAELVRDLGGNKSFARWDKAREHGEAIAGRMHWSVEYDNEAGRDAEYLINEGRL
jgi:hypothetical protein